MNKIEIEIPAGKEVDWETSAKQKQIVLKDKQLTYEDVYIKLFDKGLYFIDVRSKIRHLDSTVLDTLDSKVLDTISASTKHQLECVLAKNNLANVARYLNGEWCTADFEKDPKWVIFINAQLNAVGIRETRLFSEQVNIIFKSQELAQQAIKILGEDVVRLALEPLY